MQPQTRIHQGLDETDLSQVRREGGSKLCRGIVQAVDGHVKLDEIIAA